MTWKKTPLNTRNRRWVIEIADLRHETGDGWLEIADWRHEIGDGRLEIADWRHEIGDGRL